MPELPEVEIATRRLRAVAEGRRIIRVRALHPALRRQLSRGDLASVRGARIDRVERRGKYQLMHLDVGRTIVAHFRMSGDWHIAPRGSRRPPYARAELALDDGTRIVLDDARALSSLTVADSGREPLPSLGPDPLSRAFTARRLEAALARRRGPIKPALLDQSVASGVGNIYASEALWRARVHPAAPAASVGPRARGDIVAAIRAVLRDALRHAGRYYAESPGEPRFDVYDRAGEPCGRCGTEIVRIVQAGRSTYFCPRCQRL